MSENKIDTDLVSIKINGKGCKVPKGITVLQAAISNGIEIPRFCYHKHLSIAANCRMCLVEIKPGPKKPQASCAIPVANNMEITTNSEVIINARKGVMEFLLINHPLDCPVCDQGGECDLQDQAMQYGRSYSRFGENKRSVPEQKMGPFITTHMTRCIHCTRCIRFANEIAGIDSLVMLHRGEKSIISSLDKIIDSELSGNLADICPVGALNSSIYSGTARTWELRSVSSIDVHDAVGSSINVQSSGNAVLRILPKPNPKVNEDWLANKGRCSFDGLKNQRLDSPYIRNSKSHKLEVTSWKTALRKASKFLNETEAEKTAFLVGDMCSVEEMFALKKLALSLNCDNLDCRQYKENLPASPSALWRCNTPLEKMETSDAVLIIGSNPKLEAPLLNLRLKRAWDNHAEFALIGHEVKLNYSYTWLGNSPSVLNDLVNGTHSWKQILLKAKRPLILVGSSVVCREDSHSLLSLICQLTTQCKIDGDSPDKWFGYNYIHRAAARCGGMIINFYPQNKGKNTQRILNGIAKGSITCLYLLGCHEIDSEVIFQASKHGCKIIVQSHHGDKISSYADVILPGSAYTEKFGLYVNTEARPQWGQQAVFPPGLAKEDWRIIRALSEYTGKTLGFDTHEELLNILFSEYPELNEVNVPHQGKWDTFSSTGDLIDLPFVNAIPEYASTDIISRSSKFMNNSINYYDFKNIKISNA